MDRERARQALAPSQLGPQSTEHDPRCTASGTAERDQRPHRPEVAARGQRPDRRSCSRFEAGEDRPRAGERAPAQPHRPSSARRRRPARLRRRRAAPSTSERESAANGRRARAQATQRQRRRRDERAAPGRASRRATSRARCPTSGTQIGSDDRRAPAASSVELRDRERRSRATSRSEQVRLLPPEGARRASTFQPARQKPARAGRARSRGRAEVPSSAFASAALEPRERRRPPPGTRRAPGTTSGVIARQATSTHPAIRTASASAPSGTREHQVEQRPDPVRAGITSVHLRGACAGARSTLSRGSHRSCAAGTSSSRRAASSSRAAARRG